MTNEALYYAFLEGEEGCFTQLMERFGNPLTLYIYGYTKNFSDAEDLMIEVFSYLLVKRPRIQEGAFKAYLYKAARHMALRSVARQNKIFTMDLEQLHTLADEKAMVDAIVDTREKHDALHACMGTLLPDYREAIYLVYFEGMSHKQAGHVMGKREKQIADLIYRGKKSLKRKLEQEGITNA